MADTQEPKKTDEQIKALKQQVSGIPESLYKEAPAKPEAEIEAEKAEATKQTKATGKSAEDHRTQKAT